MKIIFLQHLKLEEMKSSLSIGKPQPGKPERMMAVNTEVKALEEKKCYENKKRE